MSVLEVSAPRIAEVVHQSLEHNQNESGMCVFRLKSVEESLLGTWRSAAIADTEIDSMNPIQIQAFLVSFVRLPNGNMEFRFGICAADAFQPLMSGGPLLVQIRTKNELFRLLLKSTVPGEIEVNAVSSVASVIVFPSMVLMWECSGKWSEVSEPDNEPTPLRPRRTAVFLVSDFVRDSVMECLNGLKDTEVKDELCKKLDRTDMGGAHKAHVVVIETRLSDLEILDSIEEEGVTTGPPDEGQAAYIFMRIGSSFYRLLVTRDGPDEFDMIPDPDIDSL